MSESQQYFPCAVDVTGRLSGQLHGDRGGRGVGLPHGHWLLGQEIRLHVGRRQQRHERAQGAAGELSHEIFEVWEENGYGNLTVLQTIEFPVFLEFLVSWTEPGTVFNSLYLDMYFTHQTQQSE